MFKQYGFLDWVTSSGVYDALKNAAEYYQGAH